MADAVSTRWVYPPNWDGGLTKEPGYRTMTVKLTNYSDGTGESAVTKVNISDLFALNGEVPTYTVIDKIKYEVNGMAVHLYWDRTPSETIARLNGTSGSVSGCMEFCKQGGLVDPQGGGTGDIMLTTVGHTSGDGYDITITFILKN